MAEGGLTFRARFGVAHNGTSILADGSYSKDSEIKDGYPEFTMAMLKKLGWDKDLTAEERAADRESGGGNAGHDGARRRPMPWRKPTTTRRSAASTGRSTCPAASSASPSSTAARRSVTPRRAPWCGNSRIRSPLHREPLYTPRRDLVAKYPTYTDRKAWRLPTLYASIQKVDHSKNFPTILTSGRLVEYEGGGDESRSNKWLAELQQEMFCEVNPPMPASSASRTAATCGCTRRKAARSW